MYKYHSPILYWNNYGGIQKTYIEIKFVEKTGAIYEFVVVTMPKEYIFTSRNISKNVVEKIGLPLFDTSLWNNENHHLRERLPCSGDFSVFVENESVFIVFLNDEVVLKVKNKNIIFGFDKNNILCFIQLVGMKLNKEVFLEEI